MRDDRHLWYETESKDDPVLGEIILIWQKGAAGLARPSRVELPNIVRAARMLIGEQANRKLPDFVGEFLSNILDENNAKWVRGEDRRNTAMALFGLDDETYGKAFRSRRAEAANRCDQAVATFRRPERRGKEAPLLREIASAVAEI